MYQGSWKKDKKSGTNRKPHIITNIPLVRTSPHYNIKKMWNKKKTKKEKREGREKIP